ncbi:MAG: transcription elongation factor GreB [Bdellovibrio sp.]|nr:transcription elongation factor GreB [Bdellovibrio sp.]
MAKNYITPAGNEKLKAELHRLLVVERPELVKVISWAASNGDRSENGDYIYGKRRLREIDRRIRFLTQRIESAEVVDPKTHQGKDKVLFGATVTVLDENERERKFKIVGQDELAKALLNAKKGDFVQLHSPKGIEEIEVLSISYED